MRNEVNRAHKAKTTLRYLLMVVAMVSVLSVKAQGTAQLPEVQMQSTSVMMSSGSSLPQAAVTGVVTTDEAPARANIGQPRRGRPGDWTDPYKDPIGDAVWPLMLLACAYLIIRVVRARKRA